MLTERLTIGVNIGVPDGKIDSLKGGRVAN